ncbi:MAG TPA: ferritin-like domain-containing protein [Mobilitalea sp.]|nr:ferritin-like domain-containing protein [Mobilitalea sp.]
MYYNYMSDQDQYYGNQMQDAGDDMDMGMGMDMGMNVRQSISGRDINLESEIAKAITGEVQAYYFYEKLMELAPNEEIKNVIKGIQEDEAKHYHWFTAILRRMGAEIPQVPAGEMPTDFEEGVKRAIRDELEANEFYLDIAYRATDPFIEKHFRHASQDEQRHATLFLNILMNMM